MIARLLVSLLLIICLAGGAKAEFFWSTVGNSCVPADPTIKFNRHKVDLASVQHAPDNVDLIALNRPVTPFDTPLTNWNLGLTYRDSTGRGTSASIRARLFQMEIGTVTPILVIQLNSNAFPPTENITRKTPDFTHTFDFSLNNYWVRVDLDRSSTSEIVIFHSLYLEGAPS